MKRLQRQPFRGQVLRGALGLRPMRVAIDSRSVEPEDAFIAAAAEPRRAAHIGSAVAAGASAVVAQQPCTAPVPVLTTPCARWSAARAGAAQHELDLRCPTLVGVTGTDGKTTTAWYAWACLGPGAGRVGTLGYHDGQRELPGSHTTPPADDLQAFLAGFDQQAPGIACEVSSHAIDQHRLAGLCFAGMAFTTIGSDHLDYHRHHQAYVATKLRAARLLSPGGLGIVNADDPRASSIVHALRCAGARIVELGLEAGSSRIVGRPGAWRLRHAGAEHVLAVAVPGSFNAWNAAAGALLATAAGQDLGQALARLASAPPVPGRLERVLERPLAYVDYAHTPGAVARVLEALRVAQPERRLVCVVGCGGNRDRSKRGPMARAACAADHAVLTSDNPRDEAPQAILDDMLAALDPEQRARVAVAIDRGEALRTALTAAGAEGVVVVCGKGHETVQVIGDERRPWDDRCALRAAAEAMT